MCPDTSFSDLKALAIKVNIASDKLNGIIDSAEHELRSFNLGVEAFSPYVLSRSYGDVENLQRLGEVTYLGWAKHKGKWQLTLKIESEREFFNDEMSEIINSGIEKVTYVPLKDANRETRARAIEHFDNLKSALEKEMKRIVDVVEQREKFKV